MSSDQVLPSSFRDPSGFIFRKDEVLYRQVNKSYSANYDQLMESWLYAALVKTGLLIPHEEVADELALTDDIYRVIKPVPLVFISFPHEWCFSQLKDAALLTLKIQLIALRFGMVLKDASAYNIQFHQGKVVFIDSLSFDKYEEGLPWMAYKQFCQHFLAPLALMSYRDIRLSQLLRVYIDGIPLDLASKLLPRRSYLRFSMLSHIHLHAKSQLKYADSGEASGPTKAVRPISKRALTALTGSILSAVKALHWKLPDTEWGDYYSATNYNSISMGHKEKLVKEFIAAVDPHLKIAQDLGANTGQFSKIAAELGYDVISQDIDPVAVEKNYLDGIANKQEKILPLLLDLTNPSPAMGWRLKERMSFMERSDGNLVLALALVHHLAISNNVPLHLIAKFFADVAKVLIIEFVPKQDSQVRRLLASREDIFDLYHESGFEQAFSNYFTIERKEKIKDSERTLYMMSAINRAA
ncbi:MAG: SAM-dependent methyltransferase [Proteobacteria bacterium]|nr:SAM-dependent methyltransferase [Pseudomonadota bacterium]